MSAYVIVFREEIIDQSELDRYAAAAVAARAGHAIKPLALYGRQEVLEGEGPNGVVILAFPTFEEAQAWYRSPAYQDALKHRMAGAKCRAVIVEGLELAR